MFDNQQQKNNEYLDVTLMRT